MLRRSAFGFLSFALAGTILVLLSASSMRAGAQTLQQSSQAQWHGTWQTKYGPLVLRQDGRRVWGDYINASGAIGAWVQPDGRLRGTFLRSDRRWGVFEFHLRPANRGWDGVWHWNGVPAQDGTATAWNATARSGPAQMLRFATRDREFWPPDMPHAVRDFIRPPTLCCTPNPMVTPDLGPKPNLSFPRGEFTIRAQDGAYLGAILLDTDEAGHVIGRGEVYPDTDTINFVPFTIMQMFQSHDALQLDLLFAHAAGRAPAHLLLNRQPSDASGLYDGSLVRPSGRSQDWAIIALESEDYPAFDAPGVGVYAIPFSLRNHNGSAVGLRASPKADSPLTGSLAASAQDLWVEECTPVIDSLAWQDTTRANRRQCWTKAGARLRVPLCLRQQAGFRHFF